MNKKVNILIVFFIVALFSLPGVVSAAYEPSNVTVEGVSTGSAPQMVPATELVTTITPPSTALPAGGALQYYVYRWNNSGTPLTSQDLSPAETSQVPHGDSMIFNTDTALFAESNYDNTPVWYLHVKTVYFIPETGTSISDDKPVGPFTFDNVPPTGTISLAAVEGQTDDTTSINPVVLSVAAEQDVAKVYLNTSELFDTATALDVDDSNTVTYAISQTGDQTLYVWFEDIAGNVTARGDFFPLTFTVLAGKSMDPAGAISLGVNESQVFLINGSEDAETFNWSVVDADGNPADGAAFSGNSQGVATVTVKGVTENAQVYVKAESIQAGTTYTSGMITVVKSTPDFCLDIDGNGEVDAFTDGFLVIRYLFDFRGDFLINGVVGENATRTTAVDIEEYLANGVTNQVLDIDGNNEVDAFTDGFLVIRYLFDFRGDFLINGVVGENAGRTTITDIETYLLGIMCQ